MKVTILGCGSSTGVPRVGNDWGACDPNEPKNRRTRCSILVEEGGTRLLVDTAPDLRQQLLDAQIDDLDAVIYTHEHADQTHGIDDLRVLFMRKRTRLPVYGDAGLLAILRRRFDYIFEQPPGSPYPPIAETNEIDIGKGFEIGAIEGRSFAQQHGSIVSLGLRFGKLAYSNDVHELDEDAFAALKDVEVWIVDALRHKPHPTHAHLDRTLEWIARVKPRRAVLTNMHVDMDYQSLRRMLPEGVEPGYDGMVIELP
ncbi:MAG: MBL fold metallo-hydrolase [Alphaproteobacteria bacterium]|nr:MBL fold metallo-hydrolase [Alphaproteobacteria bacterium]